MTVRIITGDVRERLRDLPDASVHCVVTSPPYFGLRDYGVAGQIGLEATPGAYVADLVAVFREVRRVLRDDGTLWLNLGDSYASGGERQTGRNDTDRETPGGRGGSFRGGTRAATGQRDTLKPKDLIGIPWRVAFALQADGWYLRQDIIWAKPNPMPESVTDRCTKAHEYVFLLSKSARYFYDAAAIAEPASYAVPAERAPSGAYSNGSGRNDDGEHRSGGFVTGDTRNARSVWTIASQPFAEAHFATFPPDLAERCIKAGTSEKGCCPACGAPWERVTERAPMVLARSERTHEMGRTRSSGTMLEPPRSATTGWQPTCACAAGAPPCFTPKTAPCVVLDPFGGAGTTGLVADRLQRDAILIELNPAYAAMARGRIVGDAPLLAGAAE